MSEELEKLGAEALAKQDEEHNNTDDIEETEVEIEVEFDSSDEEDVVIEDEEDIHIAKPVYLG